jgi:hypothetical protein
MKRTMNNVALETVLFTVGGLQKIKVLDRESDWDENPKVVYEGLFKDFRGYRFAKEMRSQIHRTDVENDCLVFTLQTKYEEY